MFISVVGFGHVSAQEKAKALETGRSMEKVHNTSGRATIYTEADGRLLLRLTNFKTSNGPDVHVVLIAATDADDDANFLKSSTEKIELGLLKGNGGLKLRDTRWNGSEEVSNRLRLLRAVQCELWRCPTREILRDIFQMDTAYRWSSGSGCTVVGLPARETLDQRESE